MKKLAAVVCGLFLLTGCALTGRFEAEPKHPGEIFGLGYEYLNGRVYQVSCSGNAYQKEKTVYENCIKNIAHFADEKGYPYFSLIYAKNKKSRLRREMRFNVHMRQLRRYEKFYTLILADDSIISSLPNYYRAADYLNSY